VRHVIDPSLYPYVQGLSYVQDRIPPAERVPDDDALEDLCAAMATNTSVRYHRAALSILASHHSLYQWLPAEFRVGLDGGVRIESYINGLFDQQGSLYEDIASLFRLFVPLPAGMCARVGRGRTNV
jgi:hypothetical protein